MAPFFPPVNRYRPPRQEGTGIVARNKAADEMLESPVIKSVPAGWKGKTDLKRDYATSSENDEFWRAFSYGESDAEVPQDDNSKFGAPNSSGDNKPGGYLEFDDRRVRDPAAGASGLKASEDNPSMFKNSTEIMRAHHVQKEQNLRDQIRQAIDELPLEKRTTLELCEVHRQKRWEIWLTELLEDNANKIQITSKPRNSGNQPHFPVEYPVSRALDEQNNRAVKLRLYTECMNNGGLVSLSDPVDSQLPPDIKALVDLLNESLPPVVEIGGVYTTIPNDVEKDQVTSHSPIDPRVIRYKEDYPKEKEQFELLMEHEFEQRREEKHKCDIERCLGRFDQCHMLLGMQRPSSGQPVSPNGSTSSSNEGRSSPHFPRPYIQAASSKCSSEDIARKH